MRRVGYFGPRPGVDARTTEGLSAGHNNKPQRFGCASFHNSQTQSPHVAHDSPMPRQPADDVFSSSPTHPSHHNTNNLNPRNPYATAQRNFNLKRSAEAAALPSPPRTRDVKRKHYVEVELSDTEDEEDVQRTPTKATTTRSRRQAATSPEQTTPKGRTTRAHNAPASGASPALSVLAVQEEARRSPSPFPYREESPPPLGRGARRSGSKPMTHYVEEASDSDSAESVVAPVTPKRQRAPVTPPPPTRKTRAAARGPIRDSPNNPFLSNSPRYAKKNPMPLQDRETIPYVLCVFMISFLLATANLNIYSSVHTVVV